MFPHVLVACCALIIGEASQEGNIEKMLNNKDIGIYCEISPYISCFYTFSK
ncbi:hypothetical protein SELSPUOL_02126 [Selenomonas sputigena ATCC 35185]|uniref:Uncharacterized protein n=1 Tax=Selenomonas sputigena (strain ATCC 35185 / DSM 20758 / CCUG 44933 / VPI D19B-28) TaxID=546271 RepID=C9LXB8_SELS3|nr:hypothetical protein SELSPUOL_02126 [Selenomonas sputigena ATCC 35185]